MCHLLWRSACRFSLPSLSPLRGPSLLRCSLRTIRSCRPSSTHSTKAQPEQWDALMRDFFQELESTSSKTKTSPLEADELAALLSNVHPSPPSTDASSLFFPSSDPQSQQALLLHQQIQSVETREQLDEVVDHFIQLDHSLKVEPSPLLLRSLLQKARLLRSLPLVYAVLNQVRDITLPMQRRVAWIDGLAYHEVLEAEWQTYGNLFRLKQLLHQMCIQDGVLVNAKTLAFLQTVKKEMEPQWRVEQSSSSSSSVLLETGISPPTSSNETDPPGSNLMRGCLREQWMAILSFLQHVVPQEELMSLQI